MRSRDFRLFEGEVLACVGDGVTVTDGQRTHTFSLALAAVEQLEPGRRIRVLTDARHDIVRVYDATAQRMVFEKSGRTSHAAANALALQTAVMCAIPFLGAVIALLLILPMLIGRALGYDHGNALFIIRTASITFAVYLSLSIAGLVLGSWALGLAGPFLAVWIGVRLVLLREQDLMVSLSERVTQPVTASA